MNTADNNYLCSTLEANELISYFMFYIVHVTYYGTHQSFVLLPYFHVSI